MNSLRPGPGFNLRLKVDPSPIGTITTYMLAQPFEGAGPRQPFWEMLAHARCAKGQILDYSSTTHRSQRLTLALCLAGSR